MSTDIKPSNPKDAIGSKKLAMHLVPSVVQVYAALGFTEGALKYGKYNWRIAGVRMSIYLDALQRHTAKLQNGEWADPVTRVPHIANIICCAGIIADAKHSGKLTDDRPPAQDAFSELVDGEMAGITAHLQKVFKDHNPTQYTIGYVEPVVSVVPVGTGRAIAKRMKEVIKRDTRRARKARRR